MDIVPNKLLAAKEFGILESLTPNTKLLKRVWVKLSESHDEGACCWSYIWGRRSLPKRACAGFLSSQLLTLRAMWAYWGMSSMSRWSRYWAVPSSSIGMGHLMRPRNGALARRQAVVTVWVWSCWHGIVGKQRGQRSSWPSSLKEPQSARRWLTSRPSLMQSSPAPQCHLGMPTIVPEVAAITQSAVVRGRLIFNVLLSCRHLQWTPSTRSGARTAAWNSRVSLIHMKCNVYVELYKSSCQTLSGQAKSCLILFQNSVYMSMSWRAVQAMTRDWVVASDKFRRTSSFKTISDPKFRCVSAGKN